MGIGELFALICALMWATAVVLYKHVGDSMSANTLNLVKNVLGFALLLPTALIIEGLSIPELDWQTWAILIASGYFGIAVADTFYLQALRNIGASRTAIVASLYSPFVVILSIVFLKETMMLWQWLGFLLILVGILVVVYQRSASTIEPSLLLKGVVLAAVSVFLTAAGVVAMKPILSNDGFFWLVTLRMLAGIVGMVLYLVVRGKLRTTYQVVTKGDHKWRSIFIASCFGSYFALLFWLGGFKYADASVASVLNETANIFIVLMAAMFLKEALSVRKIVGVALTFCGVLVFLGLLLPS